MLRACCVTQMNNVLSQLSCDCQGACQIGNSPWSRWNECRVLDPRVFGTLFHARCLRDREQSQEICTACMEPEAPAINRFSWGNSSVGKRLVTSIKHGEPWSRAYHMPVVSSSLRYLSIQFYDLSTISTSYPSLSPAMETAPLTLVRMLQPTRLSTYSNI